MDAAGPGTSPNISPNTGGIAGEKLRALIDRIERLEEEKKALAEDVKDVYGEAKALGFEPKIMRRVISLRRMDAEKRREEDSLLEIYLHAIEGLPAAV